MSLPGSPPEPGPLRRVLDQVGGVVVGHQQAVLLAVVAIVAGGHLLLEDLPGVGKTTLATALARSLGLSVRRIQGTADLLPADLTGALIPDPQGELRFRPGPLFANVVLADELNRASPRAQSALLEAMEEAAVTVDGTTYRLPQPFVVLATQNPSETDGAFPLPQSQKDRFLLCLTLGYPDPADELDLLTRGEQLGRAEQLAPALRPEELLELRARADTVHVAPGVRQYLLGLLVEIRRHPAVLLGPSPRAGLGLQRAARALAVVRDRDFVLPEDLQELLGPALAHRVQLTPAAALAGRRPGEVLAEALARVPAPGPGRLLRHAGPRGGPSPAPP